MFYFMLLVSMVPKYQTIPGEVVLFFLVLSGTIFEQKFIQTRQTLAKNLTFLPADHETNKVHHILLYVTVHKTSKERRIDRRYRQIWPLSSRPNNRSIDNFLVNPQSVSRRSLQSQQRKPVYFWYSGRSVGSRHPSTLIKKVHTCVCVHTHTHIAEPPRLRRSDCCDQWDH